MDSSKSGNHRTVLVHYFHLCTIPDYPQAAKMVRNLIDWFIAYCPGKIQSIPILWLQSGRLDTLNETRTGEVLHSNQNKIEEDDLNAIFFWFSSSRIITTIRAG